MDGILAQCPTWYSSGPDHPFDAPHLHIYEHPFSTRMRAPRWAFNRRPCCDFCVAWKDVPYLPTTLHTLFNLMPDAYFAIWEAQNSIHYHFMLGLDSDGSDSYLLARELDFLSWTLKEVFDLSKTLHVPGVGGLATLADQMKYLGRDVQTGPRRLRYRTMPKHRFHRGRLYDPEPWRDPFW